MELILSSTLWVNPIASLYHFSSCFAPNGSTLRLPNHDRLSSNNASFQAVKRPWASGCKATFKKSIESVGMVKFKSSDDEYDSSTDQVNTKTDDDEESTYGSDLENSSLKALSKLTGHHLETVEGISFLMSEYGVILLRVTLMVEWLLRLSCIPEVMKLTCLSKESKTYLEKLIDEFSKEDAIEIKKIEIEMSDEKDGVKAVELFLKEKCKSDPDISKMFEFFDLSCTSQDITNLIAPLMMDEAVEGSIIPAIDNLMSEMCHLAEESARIPIRSSDGSSSEQTTLGKEIATFACRLGEAKRKISEVEIPETIKIAARNYSAVSPTSRCVNLWGNAKEFVNKFLGISPYPRVFSICFNTDASQEVECRGYIDQILHAIIRFNSILGEFDKEMKGFISSFYVFKPKKASSIKAAILAGKVSTIDFEDSENSIEIANEGLYNLRTKLPVLQWERDFSANSSFLRSMAMCLGHCLFAYADTEAGIEKLEVMKEASSKPKELSNSLGEIIHGVMKIYEVPADSEPYKQLEEIEKNGKVGTRDTITEFIQGLEIPLSTKASLLDIILPHTCNDDRIDQEALEKAAEEVEDLISKAEGS